LHKKSCHHWNSVALIAPHFVIPTAAAYFLAGAIGLIVSNIRDVPKTIKTEFQESAKSYINAQRFWLS